MELHYQIAHEYVTVIFTPTLQKNFKFLPADIVVRLLEIH